MHSALTGLGLTLPVLAAPMAGGPSTPGLVAAAAAAGSLGFLAGGYKEPELLADEISQVRAGGTAFGVNLFAPNPVPINADAYHRYRRAVQREADRYGLDLSDVRITEDDDHWQEKVDLLVADPVPVVSFTFGLPEPTVVAALQKAGTLVAQTVTSATEASLATERGVDVLVVQASAAGGHSGTWTPHRTPPDVPLLQLLTAIGQATRLPLLAAGGLATATAVAAAISAGAAATVVGTVLLRCDESGASAPHRAVIAEQARRRTVVTRAFTGRPARALTNTFTERYSSLAPTGYPALHHLTSRIRKAAAAANDAERINLWAGTGYRHATAEPAARILAALASEI